MRPIVTYLYVITSLQICGFAICGLGHKENLRINLQKFAELRLVGWHTSEICDCGMSPTICGFAMCWLAKKMCMPTFAWSKDTIFHPPGIMPPVIPSLTYVYILFPLKSVPEEGGKEGGGAFSPLPPAATTATWREGGLSLGSTGGRLNYTVINRYSRGEYVSVPRLRIRWIRWIKRERCVA